jgi:hypothetical protein
MNDQEGIAATLAAAIIMHDGLATVGMRKGTLPQQAAEMYFACLEALRLEAGRRSAGQPDERR